jgi:hypothetical protein
MNNFLKVVTASIVIMLPVSVQAQSVGNLLGGPVVAAGNIVSGVAAIHHQALAPTVSGVVPTVAPVADGVTNALGAVGSGVAATGQSVQQNGVVVGAGGAPLVSVGSSNPATQGTVAAVANGQ